MNRGFTLMELLIVIGIVAILAASGVFAYSELIRRGRDARRRTDIQTVAGALDQYYLDNDQLYPADPDCGGIEDYLEQGQFPIDPLGGADPTYTYDWSDSCSVGRDAFCVCALMETGGAGNAAGRIGSDCTWTGDQDYYCVNSKQ